MQASDVMSIASHRSFVQSLRPSVNIFWPALYNCFVASTFQFAKIISAMQLRKLSLASIELIYLKRFISGEN